MQIIKITGQIEVLTGLHIGGGDDVMKIGGIDNPIIKEANGKNPYIPGSSIKGKMRSLLEWNNRLVGHTNGKPFGSDKLGNIPEPDKKNAINLLKLFGDASSNNEYGITRISIGDCRLSEESKHMKLTEAKYENTIDRKSGTASNPRQTERVPAGIKFDFDIRIKILDGDDKDALLNMVKSGMELLESDYLGGSGSRGYGRIKFHKNG
ncbi:MAG: type III-A CRISPR-associated RAMP protein Csm3 [Campylobacterales bacterium]|nr:type III-A CRISPR-associated RAMP protein Csm3 [Campylobacterales bacterium]